MLLSPKRKAHQVCCIRLINILSLVDYYITYIVYHYQREKACCIRLINILSLYITIIKIDCFYYYIQLVLVHLIN